MLLSGKYLIGGWWLDKKLCPCLSVCVCVGGLWLADVGLGFGVVACEGGQVLSNVPLYSTLDMRSLSTKSNMNFLLKPGSALFLSVSMIFIFIRKPVCV